MQLVNICNVIVSESFLLTNYSHTRAAMPRSGTRHAKILPLRILQLYFDFIRVIQDKVKEHAARVENTGLFEMNVGFLTTCHK